MIQVELSVCFKNDTYRRPFALAALPNKGDVVRVNGFNFLVDHNEFAAAKAHGDPPPVVVRLDPIDEFNFNFLKGWKQV